MTMRRPKIDQIGHAYAHLKEQIIFYKMQKTRSYHLISSSVQRQSKFIYPYVVTTKFALSERKSVRGRLFVKNKLSIDQFPISTMIIR